MILFIFVGFFASGQERDTIRIRFDQMLMLRDTIYYGIQDSVVVLDSAIEYEVIKNFMVRKPSYYERKPEKRESVTRLHNKYGKLLMGQIRSKKETLPEDFNPSDNYYTFFKNRVIKEIKIEGVPILDGNLFDTTNVNISGVGRFLNKTYSATRERIIRNNLKFKENEPVNARIFSDNERLLRNLSYIEDARIQIVPVENTTDSVIVQVWVKDKYPVGVSADLNDYNAFEIEPYTRNLLGLGHHVGAVFQYDGSTDDKVGYGMYYAVDNLGGSFVNSKIQFNNGLDQDLFRVQLSKPFVTTYTKFGGEIEHHRLREKISEKPNLPDTIYPGKAKYRVNTTDIWLGYSILPEHNIKHPFINVAGRIYAEKYKNRPHEYFEFNYPFHDQQLYLASVSLQQVSYIKTSKLIQFGIIEDVPIGFNANLTGGWQHTTFINRPYAGARLNYSKFFQNAGIFSTGINVGGYPYKSTFEDAVTTLKFNYISPLGKWKGIELRNIFEVSYNSVRNARYLIPLLYSDYVFTLNQEGIYSDATVVLNYHPVFYTKHQLWGFRFSLNPFVNIGWVDRAETFTDEWESFSVVGLNLSTKNESLIFPAMHMHFSYYPNKITGEPRFEVKLVFKDIKLFKDFTSLKPETAHP
ncbi:hypothetical protein OU798_01525 [Prolixibacteraceae bacterium Z1-6]|uniref:Outer membrane protein assembly factor BamA n=1 Tax=Draconibacterium aestuarii TaxID=2998507 RepID=A0A9X3F3A2_9BACT|nr:hypothetical protein [Prolixibacteraceae bacterium Z1-6]